MLASPQGHPALSAGDAVGANLVILTLTLGPRRRAHSGSRSAAPRGRTPSRRPRWAPSPGGPLDGVLGRGEGLLLVVLYVGGVAWVWRRERQPPLIGELTELDDETVRRRHRQRRPRRALPLVLSGVLGMVVGGALAVRGADGLVEGLGGQRVGGRPDRPRPGHQRRDGRRRAADAAA